MKRTFAILLLLFLQTAMAHSNSELRDRKAIEALSIAVKNLSLVTLHCHENSDCKNLELGSKACGGPQSYLLTSTRNPNYSIIKFLTKKTVAHERAFNIRYDIISDCSTPENVATRCQKNKCIY